MKLFYASEFGKAFIPRKIRPKLRKYLLKAGIEKEPYAVFGALFYLAFLITLIVFFFFWEYIIVQNVILVGLITFVIWTLLPLFIVGFIMVSVYFYIDLRIFNRTRRLEAILPDFLASVSSHLKGGLSFEKALWLSIKPRYGILSEEVMIAAKKVMTGNDVDTAMNEFADKYNSPMLKRAMQLIVSEIMSGGKVADIMDDVVHSMKKTKELKEEMNASVITYMIFISAIVIFIAPVLFALSLNLLSVIQRVTALLGATSASVPNLLGNIAEVSVDRDVFISFSRISILVVSFFASLIVSIIEKGSIKGGVKYIPIFVVGSQLFYSFCLIIFNALFGALINF